MKERQCLGQFAVLEGEHTADAEHETHIQDELRGLAAAAKAMEDTAKRSFAI